MTKEQIKNFKELHSFFDKIAEDISKKFAEAFKIRYEFCRTHLNNNYISITYYDYDDSYYDGEDEIDHITIDYEDLLLGRDKVLENLINERKKEIEFEKEQEKQKQEKERQEEFQNELELYQKLKKKFEPTYDD